MKKKTIPNWSLMEDNSSRKKNEKLNFLKLEKLKSMENAYNE
jgi:hypothetical protein